MSTLVRCDQCHKEKTPRVAYGWVTLAPAGLAVEGIVNEMRSQDFCSRECVRAFIDSVLPKPEV